MRQTSGCRTSGNACKVCLISNGGLSQTTISLNVVNDIRVRVVVSHFRTSLVGSVCHPLVADKTTTSGVGVLVTSKSTLIGATSSSGNDVTTGVEGYGLTFKIPEAKPEAIPLGNATARSKPEGWNDGRRPNGADVVDIVLLLVC